MKKLPPLAVVLLAATIFVLPARAQSGNTPGSSRSGSGVASAGANSPSPQDTTVTGLSFQELSQVPEGRALLAMTAQDYMVTPGDTYTLSFVQQEQSATMTLLVDTDYQINLGVFGKISGRGLTFVALKRSVEQRVAAAYPSSSPELIMRSTGVFVIQVRGEVNESQPIQTWALARLSSLLDANDTPYTSYRDIQIKGSDGTDRRFDLFKARRFGDLTQDPYLRPGDVVTFGRAERVVTVNGQVRRPAEYQLLPGEGLKELMETYGDGFTQIADPTRIKLTRYIAPDSFVGKKAVIDYTTQAGMPIVDLDSLSVPSAQELLPVVYFEGALGVGVSGEGPQAAHRVPYNFFPGENLSDATRALRTQFSAVSDLNSSYVLRAGARIPVSLAMFLNGSNLTGDMVLQSNDTVIVPFRQFFVSVAGAVKLPGRYPYVPDRTWDYYVNLAGGVEPDKNAGDQLTITDLTGKSRSKMEPIGPEYSIVMASNNIFYSLVQISTVLTALVSIASLVISLLR